jgi:hypothetical protein
MRARQALQLRRYSLPACSINSCFPLRTTERRGGGECSSRCPRSEREADVAGEGEEHAVDEW